MRKYILLIVSMLLCGFVFAQNNTIEPELQEILDKDSKDLISVNIVFKSKHKTTDKTDRKEIIDDLKSFSRQSQENVMSVLLSEEKNSNVEKVRSHWLTNVVNCKASREVIYMLASHPDIAMIGYDKDEFLLWDSDHKKYDSSEASASSDRGLTQNITHVNADDVWNQGFTGKGVLVGLIDTGVNIEHIDLVDNLWDGGEEFPNHGYNTYEDNHNVSDGFGHGTHCAGTICGNGASGTQTGIAPDATIMVVKVMDDGGYGGASSICAGMEFAIEHGADILNMSLGIPNASTSAREMMREACVNTMQIGLVATVAAGNEGQLQISFPVPNNVRTPGSCPPPWIHPDQEINAGGTSCCIVVGAVDFNNEAAAFSSRGPVTWAQTLYDDYHYEPEIGLIRPDVCAPGVGIISANPFSSTGLTTMDGTSQAAPCVAGVVCLMLEKKPELTPEEISMILETTASKLDDNKNNARGSGLIDALAAIEQIDSDEEECIAPTSLAAAAIDEYSIALSWNASPSAESYDIYRDDSFVKNVTETVYNDTELNPNTEYCYTVVSVCVNGESDHSSQVCETTNELIIPCDAPANLSYLLEEDIDNYEYRFRVTLTWDEADNAAAYKVYLDGEDIAEVTTPSYVYGCDDEKTVSFSVATKCENNDSEMSEPLTVEIKYQSVANYGDEMDIYFNSKENELIINAKAKIQIVDMMGRVVYNEEMSHDNNRIDISNLQDGAYIVRVLGNDCIKIRKIVIN